MLLAMVGELVEYWVGEDSRRQSSRMVSHLFFSFPFVHQNLFIVSPYRCLFAFIVLWLWSNVVDWISWILVEMRLAASRLFFILSLGRLLALFVRLSLAFSSFFCLRVDHPGFQF